MLPASGCSRSTSTGESPAATPAPKAAKAASAGERDSTRPGGNLPALASPGALNHLPRAPLPQANASERSALRVAVVVPRRPAAPTPFGILAPHEKPQIYRVNIWPTSASAGDVVSGTVTTSSNVASVVASVAGISSGIPKVGVGQFAMSYRLPSFLPPIAKGTFTIVVVARNVDGASASRSVAITLH